MSGELSYKQGQMRALLTANELDGLLLQRASSFAWATCGGSSFINTASSFGEAWLLVTQESQHLIANNIEMPRLVDEENLAEQGWQLHSFAWHSDRSPLGELTADLKLGADNPFPGAADLSAPMARLRSRLTEAEGNRFRELGRACAAAMDAAIRAIRPGQSEFEIAARLGHEAQARGAQPIVNLIAVDERISAFRHPLPTDRKLGKYAMLVLCGRRYGLVCSLTRLVHFGPLPADLQRREAALADIDAAFISATRPGQTLGGIFKQGQAAYGAAGFADEWRLHHQGGPAGYEPREFVARPSADELVTLGQAFAWNPSITGAKSEDTILVGADRNEVLTAIAGWPMISGQAGGELIRRPAILVVA